MPATLTRWLSAGWLICAGLPVAHGGAISEENLLPGTAAWLPLRLEPDRVEAFASPISVANGEQIQFFVNTGSPEFQIDIYRLGWYQSLGGRLYLSSGRLPGNRQPSCEFEPATRMTSCANWQPSFVLTIPGDWLTGVYWAKITESERGSETVVLFVVRNESSNAPLLVQLPFTTYQAYNSRGGNSLYEFNSDDSDGDGLGERAFKVSFDRPYERR